MSCESIQQRLTEHALARAEAAAADRAHAQGCPACAAHARFLRGLVAELDAFAVPEPPASALAAGRERALAALREQQGRRGFVRDLLRGFALALLALPAVLVHAWLVTRGALALLGSWLPEPVLIWLGVSYFGSIALVLGVLYGSIPLAVAFARRPRPELA